MLSATGDIPFSIQGYLYLWPPGGRGLWLDRGRPPYPPPAAPHPVKPWSRAACFRPPFPRYPLPMLCAAGPASRAARPASCALCSTTYVPRPAACALCSTPYVPRPIPFVAAKQLCCCKATPLTRAFGAPCPAGGSIYMYGISRNMGILYVKYFGSLWGYIY